MAIVKAEKARTDIPLVSVIAVCYNHSKFVEETLNSILSQTYENIELVIIDSNSPDNSVQVIEQWIEQNNVDCTFLKQVEPRNVSQNMNQGLHLISGEFFQGISCDDLLVKDKIKYQVNILKSNRNISAVFGDSFLIDEEGKEKGKFFKNYLKYTFSTTEEEISFPKILERNYLHPVNGLISTEIARKIGRYDESLFAEDWDFNIRLTLNAKVLVTNKCVAKYRVMDTSMNHISSNRHKAITSAVKSFLKYRGKTKVGDEIIKRTVLSWVLTLYKMKAPNWKRWFILTFLIYPNRVTLSRLKLIFRHPISYQ